MLLLCTLDAGPGGHNTGGLLTAGMIASILRSYQAAIDIDCSERCGSVCILNLAATPAGHLHRCMTDELYDV